MTGVACTKTGRSKALNTLAAKVRTAIQVNDAVTLAVKVTGGCNGETVEGTANVVFTFKNVEATAVTPEMYGNALATRIKSKDKGLVTALSSVGKFDANKK